MLDGLQLEPGTTLEIVVTEGHIVISKPHPCYAKETKIAAITPWPWRRRAVIHY